MKNLCILVVCLLSFFPTFGNAQNKMRNNFYDTDDGQVVILRCNTSDEATFYPKKKTADQIVHLAFPDITALDSARIIGIKKIIMNDMLRNSIPTDDTIVYAFILRVNTNYLYYYYFSSQFILLRTENEESQI